MLSNALSGNIDLTNLLIYFISSLTVVFLTLPVHEYAHAKTAVILGDDTPRWQGRLSLNPFNHIDWAGTACILLFGFGWAKPVQVNSRYFKNPKRDMALVALAGPFSNIVLAVVAMILYYAAYVSALRLQLMWLIYLQIFFLYFAKINISLAVFNLIPLPPLDGSRILSAVLPNKQYYSLMRYERYFYFILLALLAFNILDIPLGFLSDSFMNVIDWLASLPFRLFLR